MTTTPLWEKQPREQQHLYIYKTIYIKELKSLPKNISDVITFVENLPKSNENESCRCYNGNLIEVPTESQLQSAANRWCWTQADSDYTNYLVKLDEEKREENFHDNTTTMDNIINSMLEITNDSVEELKDCEYKTSTKIQLEYTISRTIDLLNKNLRLNHSRPTTISKSDVDVDTKIEFDGVDNLIGAFHASKKEWTKHKQSK
jgi:hypothetical protein